MNNRVPDPPLPLRFRHMQPSGAKLLSRASPPPSPRSTRWRTAWFRCLCLCQACLYLSSFLPDILRATSGAVAASMCANGADRLGTALDAYWATCNRPVGEGPGVSTQHAPNDSRCEGEELCYKAGVCLLHSVEGRRLRSVRNRLVRELLLRCPRGSREFSMLLDGFIVLRWVGKPKVSLFGGEFEGSDDPELVTKYWHLSFFLQRPITPVFMDMQSDETDEALAGEHGVIELTATPGAPINAKQSRGQVRHGVCSLSS